MENINMRGWRTWRIGADIDLRNLVHCKRRMTYDEVILCDARRLPFRTRSVDCMFCVELIEHLPKSDGMTFLEDAERIARKQVIVTTPVGYVEAHGSRSSLLQHVSGWQPEEFRDRGYKVRGMIGPISLPMHAAYWISHILCPTYFSPDLSHEMICVKRIDTT